MKNKYSIITLFISFLLVGAVFSFAQESDFTANLKFTNNPDEELIFMKLRRTLMTKANPRDAQIAKFGIAEYYFKNNDFSDAFRDFNEYTKDYRLDASTLLAKIYLYKIALIKKDADLANSFKKEIFGDSFILLFSKFKILKYRSAFKNGYEIHYYLDRIKVFLNGEAFEEINP